MEKGFLISTKKFDVYENMACDEVLCETMPSKYILRFFEWSKNGVTFGFSQRYNNVIETLEEKYKSFDITRRPTGGGIVIHESDLTFSFIFYSPEMFNPNATYEKLHCAIHSEYLLNGINLDMANGIKTDYNVNTPTMDCFKKPVEKDLVFGGKKILGGALRKFSDYILYQASLQIEDARDNISFHKDIILSAFSKAFDLNFENFVLNDDYYDKIKTKKTDKYLNLSWIRRI
ncbi:MAG: hypothetical protein N2Z60_07995 [Elusimicrobiales bacterium]|nr:hypothetical protein [Elusimicrobiales bacterium]